MPLFYPSSKQPFIESLFAICSFYKMDNPFLPILGGLNQCIVWEVSGVPIIAYIRKISYIPGMLNEKEDCMLHW